MTIQSFYSAVSNIKQVMDKKVLRCEILRYDVHIVGDDRTIQFDLIAKNGRKYTYSIQFMKKPVVQVAY